MFHRPRKPASSSPIQAPKNATRMVSAVHFLAEEKRQSLLAKLRHFSGLETSRYQSLCALLIENLVNYCQSLPETTNSYYSLPGGVVDYALNRTEAALSLFHDFLALESSNVLSEEQNLWQYAFYTAALLQGIGKLFVDYRIQLFDAGGQLLKLWNPLLESLNHTGSQYDYELQKEADVDFRCRLNLLLAKALMPVSGFAWIASDAQVLAVWLALLNEDYRSAGTLGALLIRADAIAIHRYFNEFMLRTASIRSGRARHPVTFTGGVPESLVDKEQALGIEFIEWFTKAIDEGKVVINKAPLLMVPGGMLMTQELFQLFVREHPEYKNWQAIQKAFLSLGLHTPIGEGQEISRFEQAHTHQMHTGVVFSKFALALSSLVGVHLPNTGKEESMTAIELIHRAQYTTQFSQHHAVIAVPPLQLLTASGQWQALETSSNALKSGVKRGV